MPGTGSRISKPRTFAAQALFNDMHKTTANSKLNPHNLILIFFLLFIIWSSCFAIDHYRLIDSPFSSSHMSFFYVAVNT